MTISAGRMNSYVQFIKDTQTSDGMGGFDLAPQVLWEGQAFIERLQSFRGDVERMTAGAVGAHPIVRIHVRYDEQTAQLLRTGSQYRCIETDEGITMNVNFAQDMDGRKEIVVVTATENLPS
jgi:head-tail adaptor